MSVLAELRFRLRALFARRGMERELDDELRFHIEREMEKYMRQGMPRAEAGRRARIAFGGLQRIKDDTRDAHGVGLADRLSQDVRYAWRALRARPGFTATIVLTLGLGIGANAAMFGIVDRLLFRPPPFLAAPERVHRVYVDYVWDTRERTESDIEYRRYLDLRGWTTSFDRTAVSASREVAVGTGDVSQEIPVAAVSASLFPLFDARPVIGRFFSEDEDRAPAGTPVAVLSYTYWQLKYGGTPDVLGKSVQVDRAIYTIIGVAPPAFVGIPDDRAPAIFIPVTAYAGTRRTDYHQQYGWSWLQMFARRKPGVSLAAANADLTAAYQRSWESERSSGNVTVTANAAHARAFAAPIQVARGPIGDAETKVATWLMAVAVIVLLVACANVANLLLARAVSRRREIAVRLALGVSRGRLMQQLMTESVLLAVFGGVAGVAAAQWGGRALRVLLLRDDSASALTDTRTLLFVAATALGVAVLTGLAPALHAMRDDVSGSLKAGAREGTYHRSRLRTALLLFQAAFSLVLLVGAGLFVRSLTRVKALRMGYDAEPVVYVEGNSRGVQFTPAEAMALLQRLLDAMTSTPGVRSATYAITVPFWSTEGHGAPKVPGRDSLQKLGRFVLQAGSPSYFETMGTRIIRGHGFTDADNATSASVAVVSEAMARAIWPAEDAVGKVMRIGSDTTPYLTVIGVAENIRTRDVKGDPEFTYYLPINLYMRRFGPPGPEFFVRVSGRAADYAEPLRRRLQQEMPGASYIKTMPLEALVAPSQRSWALGATMFVAFGGLALVLAAIGLYSVVTYGVAQRTHELGVRIALGAGVGDVVRLVLAQAVRFAVGGVVIGGAIAFVAADRMQPLLYGTSSHDPAVFGSVAALLVFVALAATLRPALRATRVDPTIALRSD